MSSLKLKDYEIKSTWLQNNKKLGRTTTIIYKPTGKKLEMMGVVSKTKAIKVFKDVYKIR